MKNISVQMGDLVKEILENYELNLVALGRSEKTISWYIEILIKYFAFLSQSNILKPLGQMGSKELQAYLLHLRERNRWPENKYIKNSGKLSPFSIQGHVRAIKAFWAWLLKEGLITENPLAKSPLPKVPQNLIQTISAPDMKKLLEKIDRSSPAGDRLYCMLLLLIDTGIRVSELVNIKMADVTFPRGLIKVTGKGQKERLVPFCGITRKALLKYRDGSRNKHSSVESDYLFPQKYGNHVSVGSVQQALRRLAKKAGLQDVKCHPHIFRHTFATMFISNDGAAPILKEIMGHASFQTTEKYIHPKTEDLKIQHQLHTPLEDIFKAT